jgi:hypothetical protein
VQRYINFIYTLGKKIQYIKFVIKENVIFMYRYIYKYILQVAELLRFYATCRVIQVHILIIMYFIIILLLFQRFLRKLYVKYYGNALVF